MLKFSPSRHDHRRVVGQVTSATHSHKAFTASGFNFGVKRDDLDEDGEDEIHHVWKEELLVVTTVIDD